MADEQTPAPLNREQRRAQRFHRSSRARQDNLRTQRQNTSGFLGTIPAPVVDERAEPQAPRDPADDGTGDAAESADQRPTG